MLGCVLGDIIDKQGSNGASVVGSGDGPEILLPSGVPHLQLDDLVIQIDDSRGKLDSKGDLVFVIHFLLDELGDDATFADAWVRGRATCVADDDEF